MLRMEGDASLQKYLFRQRASLFCSDKKAMQPPQGCRKWPEKVLRMLNASLVRTGNAFTPGFRSDIERSIKMSYEYY